MRWRRAIHWCVVLSAVLVVGCSSDATVGMTPIEQAFQTSLHRTRAGMATWYDADEGGFELLTDVPYTELACNSCHHPEAVDWSEPTCGDCHADPDNPGAVPVSTCLGCHSRQSDEINLPVSPGDVHRDELGYECMDCHDAEEMHGDGTEYVSMLDPGASKTSCGDCHDEVPANQAHELHLATVDCSACHMQTALSCLNCHFDTEVAGGGKVAYGKVMDWTFLVNRNGKVHPGTVMTLKYEDSTFAVITPYYAHTIRGEARSCDDCHLGQALLDYTNTGRIAVTTWNADTEVLEHATGVIPVPSDYEEALTFDFVDWDGTTRDPETNKPVWTFLKSGADLVQMIDRYASPLTIEQLAKLRTFAAGLHATRKGKETWYMAAGQEPGDEPGYEARTGVPYSALVCSKCHDKAAYPDWEKPSCSDCHGDEDLTDPAAPAPVPASTCLPCHGRQGAEITKQGYTDVHRDVVGYACMDCHTTLHVHGDGNTYASMFDTPDLSCATAGCHVVDDTFKGLNDFHSTHWDEIDCSTCHMQAALSCVNCHFNDEVEGVGKWAHRQVGDWKFLLNRNGKVYPGTLMTLEYDTGEGNETFALFAPYYAHNISRTAISRCEDCHRNANVIALTDPDPMLLLAWKGGPTLENVKGIIPVPPDFKTRFVIDFVQIESRNPDNSPSSWEFLETGPDAWQMLRRYGSPLTSGQMNWLEFEITGPD